MGLSMNFKCGSVDVEVDGQGIMVYSWNYRTCLHVFMVI